jgi:hypothetical protein
MSTGALTTPVVQAAPILRPGRRTRPTPQPLITEAILRTVAYADVFDYPLTPIELHRYLAGAPASPGELAAPLTSELGRGGRLSYMDGYFCLHGREGLVELRRERAERSARLLPRAIAYGRLLAALPFVRLVALTGSLAVGNSAAAGDIDYLVVTAPGRVWLCRGLAVLLVRWAAGWGDRLCPNYFLAENSLRIEPQDLYRAHELAQMAPLSGRSTYARMRLENSWSLAFLPNSAGPPPSTPQEEPRLSGAAGRRYLETALGGGLGDRLERWEMRRKIRRFAPQAGGGAETSFCADQCKGHFEGHAGRALAAYAARLERLGLAFAGPVPEAVIAGLNSRQESV